MRKYLHWKNKKGTISNKGFTIKTAKAKISNEKLPMKKMSTLAEEEPKNRGQKYFRRLRRSQRTGRNKL